MTRGPFACVFRARVTWIYGGDGMSDESCVRGAGAAASESACARGSYVNNRRLSELLSVDSRNRQPICRRLHNSLSVLNIYNSKPATHTQSQKPRAPA